MGLPEARSEGTYLIVNKNLIEAAAVLVLLSFRTGRIAGLDQLGAARIRSIARPPRDRESRSDRGRHDDARERCRYESDARTSRAGPAQFPQGAGRDAGARRARCVGRAARVPCRAARSASDSSASAARAASLLGNVDPAYAEVRALCDINPNSLKAADEVLKQNSGRPRGTTPTGRRCSRRKISRRSSWRRRSGRTPTSPSAVSTPASTCCARR